MEGDYGFPPFFVVGDLTVGRKAPHELAGDRGLCQHGPHGVAVGPAAEVGPTDVGDRFKVKRGVLSLEVHDLPADRGGQYPALGSGRFEEAPHALLPEGGDPAVEHPFRDPGLSGPLRDWQAKEDLRPDPLVLPLLVPGAQEFKLLPAKLVGRVYAPPLPPSHASPSREPNVGREGCHGWGFAASSTVLTFSPWKAVLPVLTLSGRCKVFGEVSHSTIAIVGSDAGRANRHDLKSFMNLVL
jgi:hypothetical protein